MMTQPISRPARLRPVVCLVVAAALTLPIWACATRTIDTKVIERDGIDIVLRHRRERGEDVDRGFAHPVQISSERLALILASVRVEYVVRKGFLRKKVSKQRAAFETELVDPLAGALSEAFAAASSRDEIVVVAVRTERRFAVFARTFVTSFITFMEDDTLYLDLSRLHWEMPKSEEEERPPRPKRGESVMKFSLLPGPATREVGPQELAVSWRDPSFVAGGSETPPPEIDTPVPQQAPAPQPAPSSEQPDTDEAGAPSSELSPHLSSATLRELADLEEARERGDITESYYQRQRQKLLQRAAEGDTSP